MADKYPNWSRLNIALDMGDFSAARSAINDMGADEVAIMREQLGSHIVTKLIDIRRRRRGPKKGRVIILNGFVGSHLYTVNNKNEADHIWLNLVRIMLGQMARLELTPSGEPVRKNYRVESRRLHKTYLPLAFELERSWDVLPFPFDWRLDMDHEAARLVRRIQEWAQGEPVHLVAHSMGGLLARRMMQKFPLVWQSMADPDNLRRGGRLIMMGTPNKGSFAIPKFLTGKDKLVKIVSLLDLGESHKRFMRNARSFSGAYQMMPSALVDLQDDHLQLYQKKTWGKHAVVSQHLALAKKLQQEMHLVLTPERLVNIAGYGKKTLQRIEVTKPGKFRYQANNEGDGTVPHSLTLLDGVQTQWVKEKHGDLPLNDQVVNGIHDLLELGKTTLLETSRPLVRGIGESQWIDDDDLVQFTAAEQAVIRKQSRSLRAAKKRGSKNLTITSGIRQLTDAMLDEYLAEAPAGAYSTPKKAKAGDVGKKAKLKVEVCWGNIKKVRGNVYCVGHYEGVLPQHAELALDTVVSQSTDPNEMILRTHTQRGVMRGQLGEINLYPWARHYDPPRSVAVAGMGYPGQFTETCLRSLTRQLTSTAQMLPKIDTICTVLIGSGEGGLSIGQSLRGMLGGLTDALDSGLGSKLKLLRIVELDRDKASAIHQQLQRIASEETDGVILQIGKSVIRGPGGQVSDEKSLAYATAALIDAKTSKASGIASATSQILRRIPNDAGFRDNVHSVLKNFAKPRDKVADIAERIRIEIDTVAKKDRKEPARLSFWRSETATHVAALTNTAVKPERISRLDPALIDQLRLKLEDPHDDEVARFGSMLHRLIVPRDFRDVLDHAESMVIEVDRPMSTINWEMLTIDPDSSKTRDCIGLQYPLARQLRTQYSPPPSPPYSTSGVLRALVIGDPGDPEFDENLPGAREEALQVTALLRKFGVDVTLRLGAPVKGNGPVSGIKPASRLEVLELLQTQRFDILHYAGHGDFQDDEGLRSGWLFKGGMISAAELETIDTPPRLIVANACLSARTSTQMRSGERIAPEFGDAGLLPSLVDEFLRRGVRDYIGTAWEIEDEGAILFARQLYTTLLTVGAKGEKATLGQSMLQARTELHRQVERYWSLWAAYQHYGDPALVISPDR